MANGAFKKIIGRKLKEVSYLAMINQRQWWRRKRGSKGIILLITYKWFYYFYHYSSHKEIYRNRKQKVNQIIVRIKPSKFSSLPSSTNQPVTLTCTIAMVMKEILSERKCTIHLQWSAVRREEIICIQTTFYLRRVQRTGTKQRLVYTSFY